MKKSKTTNFFSAIFILTICISLFTSCGAMKNFKKIDSSEVEKIVAYLGSRQNGYELSKDETAKFIELFNSSEYIGEDVGYETTSLFDARIHLGDGAFLDVNDWFSKRILYVWHYDEDENIDSLYFIENAELWEFLSNLIDQHLSE